MAEVERLVRTGWSLEEVNGWFRDEFDYAVHGSQEDEGGEEEALSEAETIASSDSPPRTL